MRGWTLAVLESGKHWNDPGENSMKQGTPTLNTWTTVALRTCGNSFHTQTSTITSR